MRTITEVGAAYRTGSRTPIRVLDECLAVIDQHEAALRAWVVVDRDRATAEAVRLTEELRAGRNRGPLHGIPVGVKDIFDVAGLPTAAGSPQWANKIADRDSEAVARLRSAGAIILGKTVTTAYASFDPPPTANPWSMTRTPGGSSSGSAAAVAAGMCFTALASQTGGSITRPAAYCGVCSLKPTYGRIATTGVLPLAWSLDHVGFMASCVGDLQIVERVLRDADVPNTVAEVRPLLLPTGIFAERMEPAMAHAFRQRVQQWRTHGTSIPEVTLPSGFADVTTEHRTMMAVEAAAFHEARLREFPEEYPPCVTSLMQEGFKTSAPSFARTRRHYEQLRHDFDAWMYAHQAILLTPATTGPAPDRATTGDPLFNSPWSYLGLPTVSLPFAWTDDGLPLSMQLIGPRHGEETLFATARELERHIAFTPRLWQGIPR